MGPILYTTTGCMRCKIVKGYLQENGIDYVERNIKADGHADFVAFYREHHDVIFRGPDGIAFPILSDGKVVMQGVGRALAYLQYGTELDGYFGVGILHHEWIDGIHISDGNPDHTDDFIQVVRYLKAKKLKLQIDSCGINPAALQAVVGEKLADVLVMNILGPLELYPAIRGEAVDEGEIKRSLALASHEINLTVETVIQPVQRPDGTVSYLTPDEVAEVAQLVATETGNNKWNYRIRTLSPYDSGYPVASLPAITDVDLLRYRAAARKYLVYADIARTQEP